MDKDLRGRVETLSARERDCLRLVFERRVTKEIADQLDLRDGTVFRYLYTAQRKLGAANRRQAAEWLAAVEGGAIVSPPRKTWFDRIVSGLASLAGVTPERIRMWLPVRPPGAKNNVLSLTARAIWPIALAVATAVGFGMLAVGADVVSRLLASLWVR